MRIKNKNKKLSVAADLCCGIVILRHFTRHVIPRHFTTLVISQRTSHLVISQHTSYLVISLCTSLLVISQHMSYLDTSQHTSHLAISQHTSAATQSQILRFTRIVFCQFILCRPAACKRRCTTHWYMFCIVRLKQRSFQPPVS